MVARFATARAMIASATIGAIPFARLPIPSQARPAPRSITNMAYLLLYARFGLRLWPSTGGQNVGPYLIGEIGRVQPAAHPQARLVLEPVRIALTGGGRRGSICDKTVRYSLLLFRLDAIMSS